MTKQSQIIACCITQQNNNLNEEFIAFFVRLTRFIERNDSLYSVELEKKEEKIKQSIS